MYDQVRNLNKEIEENLSRANDSILLKTDGEACADGAAKAWACADPGRCGQVCRDYSAEEVRRLTGSMRIRLSWLIRARVNSGSIRRPMIMYQPLAPS